MLRRGKSTAFVETRIISDGELAMVGTFLFMAERPSPVNLAAPAAPVAPLPETAEPAMRGQGPAYRSQMEFRHAASLQDRGKPELLRWVRLRERDGIDPVSELILIGDALPAGILPMLEIPPIVSSANWTIHLHGSNIVTHDGWWLVQAKAQSALGGISSQFMSVWNRAGEAVVSATQMVSFFSSSG
jgi:acyl-CoA thioesterase